MYNEIPCITAKSWALFNANTNKVIWQKNAHKKREIASLTKIMTTYISILLLKKYKVNPYENYFKVSYRAASTIGTTAELKHGDKVNFL